MFLLYKIYLFLYLVIYNFRFITLKDDWLILKKNWHSFLVQVTLLKELFPVNLISKFFIISDNISEALKNYCLLCQPPYNNVDPYLMLVEWQGRGWFNRKKVNLIFCPPFTTWYSSFEENMQIVPPPPSSLVFPNSRERGI